MSRKRRLWATTAYGPHLIKIYMNPRMQADGATKDLAKGVTVDLNIDLLQDPARLDETLIHEFIHVLEFLNSDEAFSVVDRGGCTALAQTVGKGLSQMLRELEMAPPARK